MKLATLNDGSRDGQLAVVSHDGTLAHHAAGIAGTMQQLLDDWNFIAPQLQDLYVTLNQGKARHAFPFDARQALAPLPRAFHWAQAAIPAAAGAGAANLAAHAAGDAFLAPVGECAWSPAAAPGGGAWLVPGWAVATGDLAAGSAPAEALDAVRLVLMTATWLCADESGVPRVWGTACAPLALTPDALGPGWHAGALHPWLHVDGRSRLRPVQAGQAHALHLRCRPGELLAARVRWRGLGAGALVGWRAALSGEVGEAGSAAPEGHDAWARLGPGELAEVGAHVDGDVDAGPGAARAGAADSPFGTLRQRLADTAQPDTAAGPALPATTPLALRASRRG